MNLAGPSFCADVVRQGRALEVDDTHTTSGAVAGAVESAGYRACHGLPIRRPDGTPYGSICLLDRKPHALGPEGRGLLMAAAETIELHLRWQAQGEALTQALQRARDAEARERQARRMNADLLARVGHELRTPLNAVIGFADLMDMDTKDRLSTGQSARLSHVRAGARHLLALVEDLSDLSSIELGQMRVTAQACELGPLLHDAAAPMQVIAQAHGVTLAPLPHSRTAVMVDPKRMRQVLHNLISNAIKYNVAGGLVELELREDADQVWIIVRDTGVGMDAGQIQRLFEPYQRLGRERGAVQGSGLGLTLCKQVLEQMKAQIRVSSTPDVGTAVEVGLPRAATVPVSSADR